MAGSSKRKAAAHAKRAAKRPRSTAAQGNIPLYHAPQAPRGGTITSAAWPAVLTVGSICSGMCTDLFIRPVQRTVLKWWCERDPWARQFIDANAANTMNFDDATDPAFAKTAPPVDVVSAGFPCQPFSVQGAPSARPVLACQSWKVA